MLSQNISKLHQGYRLFQKTTKQKLTQFEKLIFDLLVAEVIAAIGFENDSPKAATSIVKVNKLIESVFTSQQDSYVESLLNIYDSLTDTKNPNIEYMAAAADVTTKKVRKEFKQFEAERADNWGVKKNKGKLIIEPESQFMAKYAETKNKLKGVAASLILSEVSEREIKEKFSSTVSQSMRSSIVNHGSKEFRMLNDKLGKSLGLGEYYFNSHTIRKSSREWCKKWAGKAISLETLIKIWKTKNWIGKYPKGSSYNPVRDNGGYNCFGLMLPVSETFYLRSVALARGKAA